MITTDTFQINPEWGALARPLIRRLENPNGLSGTLLEKLHDTGFRQFRLADIPSRKHEDWRHTPVRELLKLDLTEAPVPQGDLTFIEQYKHALDATHLVIVNGYFIPSLSDPVPEGLWIGTMNELVHHRNSLAQVERLTGFLEQAKMTPFEALVTGIISDGLCLIADPGAKPAKPLHILHIVKPETDAASIHAYKMILVGPHAELDLIESFLGHEPGKVSFVNSVNHADVGPNGRLRHYRLQDESRSAYHIGMTRVFQEADSTYSAFVAELGGKLVRNNIEIQHRGTNITSDLYGIMLAQDQQHLDTQSFIDHAEPHCVSNELFKSILDGQSRGVFNGKIIVRRDAQKTNAFQQNSTLILSKQAIMDSKPQLEIFADDVRCSHGATIGQLDEDALFYLRSRGLTRNAASAMLQRAFIGEVLDKFPHEHIRAYFDQQINKRHHV